ncbi:MAG: sigma-54-dependent transcriptional regulator [Sandaracinaceae bacterium]
MKHVLVIEDDPVIRSNLEELLDAEGYTVDVAGDGKSGVAAAFARAPDVIVCDIMMPGMDGHAVLRAVRDRVSTAAVPFIFLTARADRDEVRAGMRGGADDYITKPFSRRDLLDSIAARIARVEAFEAATRPTRPELPRGAIVESPALRAVYEQAARAARGQLSVLLLGETGSGKDVLAQSIHRSSPRASAPYVPLNCAALPESLLESELFGHERGAFTGADAPRSGLFEAAHGGTVFLDEVGDLPLTTQAKLLRVLEDRRVMRVGGRVYRDVDVRFISATNRELERDTEDGRMRRDLYFRIAGIVLTVPPLRERPEDLLPLAERFIDTACLQLGRGRPALTPAAADVLRAYAWPGNVRELRNVMEHAVTMLEGDRLDAEDLPAHIFHRRDAASSAAAPMGARGSSQLDQLRAAMRDAERQRIVDALERHGGNQTRATEELGISRRTLLHRLDEFGLPRPRKKS